MKRKETDATAPDRDVTAAASAVAGHAAGPSGEPTAATVASAKKAKGSAVKSKAATPKSAGKMPASALADTPASLAASPTAVGVTSKGVKLPKEVIKELRPRHAALLKHTERMKKGLGALLNALLTEEALGVRSALVNATKERARAQAAERAQERRAERDKERERARAWAELQKRYPIDDALVLLEPPLEEPLPARPRVRARLALAPWEQPLAPELLAVADFVASFSKHLGIEPVDVETLRLALCHTGCALPLLSEIHLPLLALVLDEAGGVQASGAAAWRGVQSSSADVSQSVLPWALALLPPARGAHGGAEADEVCAGVPPLLGGTSSALALSALSWPEAMRALLCALLKPAPAPSTLLGGAIRALATREYHTLLFPHKLALLRALVDAAACTEAISQLTTAHAEMRHEVIAEHRKAISAHNRLTDEAAAHVAKAEAMAKRQKIGASADGPRRVAAPRARGRGGGARARGSSGRGGGGSGGGEGAGATDVDGAADADGADGADGQSADGADGDGAGYGAAEPAGPIVKVLPAPPLPELSDDEDEAEAEAEAEERKAQADAADDREAELLGLSRTERQRRKEAIERAHQQRAALRVGKTRRRHALAEQARRRAEACELLERARLANEFEHLEAALDKARAAGLEWTDEDGSICRTEQLHAAEGAFALLRKLEEAEAVARQVEDKLAELPVRSQPLGEDRLRRRYWLFASDLSRLYVEGAPGEAHGAAGDDAAGAHAAGGGGAAAPRPWGYFDSVHEVRALISSLDSRGARERALRVALRRHVAILKAAMPAEPTFAPPPPGAAEAGWLTSGPHVGARVRRTFDDGVSFSCATVTKYLPPDIQSNEPALWHLQHDDGDEEDMDEGELQPTLDAQARWLAEPDEPTPSKHVLAYVNRLARTRILGKAQLGLAGLRAELQHVEAALAHALRERGAEWGGDDANTSSPRKAWLDALAGASDAAECAQLLLRLEAVARGTQAADDYAPEQGEDEAERDAETQYRRSGHEYIGARLRRFFDGKPSDAHVDGWLPAGENADEPALWHVTHDDDDDTEELEEWELLCARRAHETDATEPVGADVREQCIAEAKLHTEAARAVAEQAAAVRAHAARTQHERIWPTRAARERWVAAVSSARTLAQVSIGASALLDHCVAARIGFYSADLCRLSWMPTFAASGTQAQDQKGPRKARAPAELAERLSCWQLALAQALAQAERASAAVRRKRGRGATLNNAAVAGVEADTIGKLRELFVPTGFMLEPPPAPS
ncbi:hypothetical protein KFE25_007084 [Diacronema lutheri]|uniref:DDT domain-containing protein n=2 Tax=Diacronema lutheri TaxID=2081491 RepID=A0A8J5XTC7_DIALT|nr:hypothetical protein KFE25_007084 [Diacronema lutheri]